jgi:hypothetical protein
MEADHEGTILENNYSRSVNNKLYMKEVQSYINQFIITGAWNRTKT